MQINIPEPDLTKQQYAREGPDRFCDITKDQLLNFLEESNWGQDVDKWREHFVLAPTRNDPVCRKCSRLLDHHHTDHSRPHNPLDNFRKRAPISCGSVQSRLIRSKNPNGMHGNMMAKLMFVTNPETGEEYCRACNYRIDQHPNGQDIADAVTNALGFGGLMQGLSGGSLGGDHRRTDLSPEEQAYLDQQEEIRQVLAPERARGCPYTQEDWMKFEIDTCYHRYKEMYSLYFTSGTKKPNENITPTICVLCRKEKQFHARDYSMEGESEEEAWKPKSVMPCPKVQRFFENQRNGFAGQFMIAKHPYTGEEVCRQCKYPLSAHDDGVDQSEVMTKQIQGMVGGMLGGAGLFGGGGGNRGGAAGGGGGMFPPGFPFAGMHGQQQQQNQQQQTRSAPAAATATSSQQQQDNTPQSGYQQFGGGGNNNDAMNGDDGYIEVMQMEMCCGCIPRMVKKRVPKNQGMASMGFPFGTQQQRPPQQQSMFSKMVI